MALHIYHVLKIALKEVLQPGPWFEEVFHSDTNDNHSDMNYIKSRVESNTRYG